MISGEGSKFTLVRCEDTEGWLEQRKRGVGGSDVAAIMGLSPWKSPLEVWLEKTGRADSPDLSGKEAVAMGNELESVVLGMYRRRHPTSKVQRVNAICVDSARPWAQASLDGIVRDLGSGWGVLEIKTGSRESEWAEGVPLHYLTQVTHYLAVTGYQFADVAALVGDYGLHYHEYRVTRDEGDLRAVVEAVDEFWCDYVEKDAMPPHVSGLQSESKALFEMYKRSDGEMGPSDADRAEELAALVLDLTDGIAESTERKLAATNELKRLVGEHRGIITPDHVITWVRSEKRDGGIRIKAKR
jgi:putative phage-type endonuclease